LCLTFLNVCIAVFVCYISAEHHSGSGTVQRLPTEAGEAGKTGRQHRQHHVQVSVNTNSPTPDITRQHHWIVYTFFTPQFINTD